MFIAQPTPAKLTSLHFYAWKKGLKTGTLIFKLHNQELIELERRILNILSEGMYYLRTRPAADAIQFTLDPTKLRAYKEEQKCTFTVWFDCLEFVLFIRLVNGHYVHRHTREQFDNNSVVTKQHKRFKSFGFGMQFERRMFVLWKLISSFILSDCLISFSQLILKSVLFLQSFCPHIQ